MSSTSVTVDRAAFDRCMAALHGMTPDGIKPLLGELAQRFSAGMWKLVADEFATSTDPYGNPWLPLKHPRTRDRRAAERIRKRAWRASKGMGAVGRMMMPAVQAPIKGPKVLTDTGRMSRSTGASARGNVARIAIPTWYAAVHQNGATIAPHSRIQAKGKRIRQTFAHGITIPKRMMLPDDEMGVPPKWNEMFSAEADRLLQQRLGGG